MNVKYVDAEHMGDSLGNCTVHADSKLAIITLCPPDSIDKSGAFAKEFPEFYSVERLLLHELLHIPLAGVIEQGASEPERVLQEQAIESIADALITLDGEGYRVLGDG